MKSLLIDDETTFSLSKANCTELTHYSNIFKLSFYLAILLSIIMPYYVQDNGLIRFCHGWAITVAVGTAIIDKKIADKYIKGEE